MSSLNNQKNIVKRQLLNIIPTHINWAAWEALVEENGITIDRPFASSHPDHAEIIYPINYGYINDTLSSDGEEVDIFCGSATNNLVALIQTADSTTESRVPNAEFRLTHFRAFSTRHSALGN